MPIHAFSLQLGTQELGSLIAICPHCHTQQRLSRRALRSAADGLPMPITEALVCPDCTGVSRNESRGGRIGSALALAPFAMLLGVALAAGMYLIGSMATSGMFSPAFAAIGGVLLAVAGYFEYRTVVAMRRLLDGTKLLPLNDGLLTSM